MMPETSHDVFSPRESRCLPQYGFGANVSFDDLVQDNPFLFRVYTPRPRSPFFDSTEPFFIAQKFLDSAQSDHRRLSVASTSSSASHHSYTGAARHMDWTTRPSSSYISTSFSFAWAVWEAARRYRLNVKHDIEIAVIDARAVADNAVTAVELLRKSTPNERHKDYWKWYHFALESQDVLVYGSIPGTAVYSSIPLLTILDKLPSYFLNTDHAHKWESLFDRLAWDSTERKPSFRRFCQHMSEHFLRMPSERQIRDSTNGSVRLAIEFLRPWFRKATTDDFTLATSTVCDLASIIAQWPGQWWVHDRKEIWDLIRSMVQTMAEEIKEKEERQKIGVMSEVKRLHGIVHDLERLVQEHESLLPTPRSLTPSEGRRLSLLIGSPATLVDELPDDDAKEKSKVVVEEPESEPEPETVAGERRVVFEEPETDVEETDVEELATAEEDRETVIEEPETVIEDFKRSVARVKATQLVQEVTTALSPVESRVRPHSMRETATAILTGVLFGAFITLCVVNSQRRTLLTHLT